LLSADSMKVRRVFRKSWDLQPARKDPPQQESSRGFVTRHNFRFPPVKLEKVKWTPFQCGEKTYDLSHLHPRTIEYEVAAKSDKPALHFIVDVTYSKHCFSSDLPKNGNYDPALFYRSRFDPHNRDPRLFDFRRFFLSKQLPDIIATLVRRKCMHTGHGNFFTVELIEEDGQRVDYDVFFTASRSSIKGRLNLYVQSAFVREKEKLPAGKRIRFEIILYNTLVGKPIRD